METSNGRAIDRARLRRDEGVVERGFWRKLRRVARRVPFTRDLLAAYYSAIDPQTPAYVKAMLMGAIAYFVVPTDLLPDFIAGLGFTDDATVLLTTLQAVGGSIRERHREKADQALADLPAADPASPTAPPAA